MNTLSGNRPKTYTVHQIGALIALLGLAIWGLAVLWIHMVAPASADTFAMTYLGTFSACNESSHLYRAVAPGICDRFHRGLPLLPLVGVYARF